MRIFYSLFCLSVKQSKMNSLVFNTSLWHDLFLHLSDLCKAQQHDLWGQNESLISANMSSLILFLMQALFSLKQICC